MDSTRYLIVPLLLGFEWFDESLQMSLRETGWDDLTRPESIVIMHVQMNIVRPADIARSLRLSRQAVHATIKGMIARDLLALCDDPNDRRIKVVALTAKGEAMRRDAQEIVERLTRELTRRIGAAQVRSLRHAFAPDWGEPLALRLPRKSAIAAADGTPHAKQSTTVEKANRSRRPSVRRGSLS